MREVCIKHKIESSKQKVNTAIRYKIQRSPSKKRGLDVQHYQKRILIVDDQNFNIDAAMIILKYSVKLINSQDICDTAQNGLQAFEKVVENVKKNNGTMTTYDLILMDCNMPIMDGYEACNKIRRFLQHLGCE